MKVAVKPSDSVVSIPEPENGRGGWSIILCLFLVLFAICAVALFSMLCEDLHNRESMEKMSSRPRGLSAVERHRANSTIATVRGRYITTAKDKMTERAGKFCSGCCRNPRCWSKYAGICAKCLNSNAAILLNIRDGHKR